MRMLAKNRGERPASAEEVADAIRALENDQTMVFPGNRAKSNERVSSVAPSASPSMTHDEPSAPPKSFLSGLRIAQN